MSKIPDRWFNYTSIGKQVPNTNFIAFKVPLDEKYSNQFTINTLIEHMNSNNLKLGLIIDLTNTKRYYKLDDIKQLDIQYKKIFINGISIPSKKICNYFTKIVDTYLENNNNIIGIHSTRGVNRVGYLICKYMIDKLNINPDTAIELFNTSRGHNIERNEFIHSLKFNEELFMQNHNVLSEEEHKIIRKLEKKKLLEQKRIYIRQNKKEKKKLNRKRRMERHKANGTFKTKKQRQLEKIIKIEKMFL